MPWERLIDDPHYARRVDGDGLAGELLLEARRRAGLTQAELGRRAGVAQSVISAYESGRRQPPLPILRELVAATGHDLDVRVSAAPPTRGPLAGPLGRRLQRRRQRVRQVVVAHGADNPRVFGSVARGDDRPDSDVDLLVDLAPDTGLFALGRLQADLERVLGAPVDVVPADGLKPGVRAEVESEAVAL